jgi:hypothetical protein
MGLFSITGKADVVGVKEFVGVKLGIRVPVGGIVVFIGDNEVLFAEQDTIIPVAKNDKYTDFFIRNLPPFFLPLVPNDWRLTPPQRKSSPPKEWR